MALHHEIVKKKKEKHDVQLSLFYGHTNMHAFVHICNFMSYLRVFNLLIKLISAGVHVIQN